MFSRPLPPDIRLITVPCCEICRRLQQGDDAIARNFLISTVAAESQINPEEEIERKRNRSLERDRTLLEGMRGAITPARVSLDGQILTGTAAALDFDRPELDRIFERLARALLHEETGSGYVTCSVEWGSVSDFRIRSGFSKFASCGRSIGRSFSYAGYESERPGVWYWLVTFFGQDFRLRQRVRE